MVPNRSRQHRRERGAGAYSHVSADGARPPTRNHRQPSGTVAKRVDPRREEQRSELKQALARAQAACRYVDAMSALLGLVALEPHEPRWHQKYGEVLRTLGRNREAAAAHRRAARRYEALGFPVRASAALRLADTLDGTDSSAQMQQPGSDRPTPIAARLEEFITTVRPPRK
jgi:hypothetical protein